MSARTIRGAALALLAISVLSACEPATASASPSAAKGAEKASTKAALAKRVPDFTLRDTDGREVKLSSLRGRTVVLEWFNPDCPFVKYAHTKGPLKDAAKRLASDKLVWLSINSGAEGKQGHGVERNQQAKREYGFDNRVLLDERGEVGRAFGAEKTPHLFVIDPRGVLVYRGGLDNAPMGVVDSARPRLPGSVEGALSPYLEAALDDLSHARGVRLADTPAYGCSVKYKD